MPHPAPSALILIATGTEEIEAITPGDVLARAGVRVTYAGLGATRLTGSRGLPLAADTTIEAHAQTPSQSNVLHDALIIPGGGLGAANLAASDHAADIIRRHHRAGRLIASICAAPAVVLAPLGLLSGKRATGYPGTEPHFPSDAIFLQDAVVVDGPLITSRGPGTAMAFALRIAALLTTPAVAEAVARDMLVDAHAHAAPTPAPAHA